VIVVAFAGITMSLMGLISIFSPIDPNRKIVIKKELEDESLIQTKKWAEQDNEISEQGNLDETNNDVIQSNIAIKREVKSSSSTKKNWNIDEEDDTSRNEEEENNDIDINQLEKFSNSLKTSKSTKKQWSFDDNNTD
jgi:hypothetical protein